MLRRSSPPCAIEMPPVSSETTMMMASEISLMPIAARCRVSPRWDAAADAELKLERIITQKWIAVYPNGNEGWAEFRRTDYPRYMKTPKGGNNSGGEVANGKFIKRLRYPDSEVSNPNRPKDVDTQGTRLWWDVADTNDDGGNYVTPNNFR